MLATRITTSSALRNVLLSGAGYARTMSSSRYLLPTTPTPTFRNALEALPHSMHRFNVAIYSTMHENDPETLEREKARAVSGERLKTPHNGIDSAPGWSENPASSSEAHVKADRHPHEGSVEDLQKETVQKHERAYKEGKA